MSPPDAPTFPPSPWISRFASLLPAGGRVLDLACGGGRHGLMLAQAGHRVTFVDRDIHRIESALVGQVWAAGCQCLSIDLEDGMPWPLGVECFDLVIVTNYLHRPHLRALYAAVATDGLLLYETFALGNETYGRPRNPDFLLKPGELLASLPADMTVIAYEHGVDHRGAGPRVVQRICAQRGDRPRALSCEGSTELPGHPVK